jgi:hypothetical protein
MKRKGKSIIEFKNIDLERLESIAEKNNRKLSKQGLTELAFELAIKSIVFLDQESFENVTNLKL